MCPSVASHGATGSSDTGEHQVRTPETGLAMRLCPAVLLHLYLVTDFKMSTPSPGFSRIVGAKLVKNGTV